MSDLWLSLIPIAVAMAITPGRHLALILLLHTRQAVLTSIAFISGMATNMLIEGLAFALIFSITGIFDFEGGDGPPAIISVLFLVIGILMLVGAAKVLFYSEDEDKAPPNWLAEIDSFTPSKAYKLGLSWLFISPKQWVFSLSAVSVIFAASLQPLASLLNYLVFILIVLSLFFLLLLIYILLGEHSQAFMDLLSKWLKKNAMTILVVVFIVFGLYFLIKGITGLAA